MDLTAEQKQAVMRWAREGDGLSEIQKRLASEFNIRATYMDVRFLVLDLGVELKERKAPARAGVALGAAARPAPGAAPAPDAEADDDFEEEHPVPDPGVPAGGGQVSVTVDRIMVPGSLVSGSVTFSDGVRGQWNLDQTGRLGLSTSSPGYRPSQPDIMAFQTELRRLLETRGI